MIAPSLPPSNVTAICAQFSNLSEEDCLAMKAEFDEMDEDKSGSVSFDEVVAFVSKDGGVSEEEVETLMRKWDIDGDGTIYFKEFLQGMGFELDPSAGPTMRLLKVDRFLGSEILNSKDRLHARSFENIADREELGSINSAGVLDEHWHGPSRSVADIFDDDCFVTLSWNEFTQQDYAVLTYSWGSTTWDDIIQAIKAKGRMMAPYVWIEYAPSIGLETSTLLLTSFLPN